MYVLSNKKNPEKLSKNESISSSNIKIILSNILKSLLFIIIIIITD